ncbi:MAG: hypothetical protein HC805_07870 [Alkalinema sp. RL_2_19]|nr:hypothetical protein [Alkalinema sp. RL_2_19]
MTEPITTALIVGLAAQKFAEGAAGKAAEKLIERLWETIATRFKGRKKVEAAIGQIQVSQDPAAMTKLEKVLDGEFVEDEEFEAQLKDLAQQIVQIQNQNQTQSMNTFTSNDSSQMRAVGQVYGTANLGDQK